MKDKKSFSVIVAHIGGWLVCIALVIYGGLYVTTSIDKWNSERIAHDKAAVVADLDWRIRDAMSQELDTSDCIATEGKPATTTLVLIQGTSGGEVWIQTDWNVEEVKKQGYEAKVGTTTDCIAAFNHGKKAMSDSVYTVLKDYMNSDTFN